MTIKFTQQELDYLALKIAEILSNRYNLGKDLSNHANDPAADRPIKTMAMSVRLYNCLHVIGVLEWTPREIAYYSKWAWARFRNLGHKTFAELEEIIEGAGLQFGYELFPRDENYDVIVQKPTFGHEG